MDYFIKESRWTKSTCHITIANFNPKTFESEELEIYFPISPFIKEEPRVNGVDLSDLTEPLKTQSIVFMRGVVNSKDSFQREI